MNEKLQAVEAESKIIGSVLIEPGSLPRLLKTLKAEHFADSRHTLIWTTVLKVLEGGHPVTPVTVADCMRQLDCYKKAGGSEYLAELMNKVATTSPIQIDHYMRMVTDRYLQRSLIRFGEELIGYSTTTENPHELIKVSTDLLARMNGSVGGGDSRILQSSIRGDALLEKQVEKPASIIGDGVMTESSFVLLYGKPGLGKTWLALQAALAVALGKPWLGLPTQQRRVGIIELEMHEYYLKDRLLELVALMDPDEGREALANIDIIVRPNFTGPIDLMETVTRDGIINWSLNQGTGMLILDAMSRMHYAAENNAQEMGHVLASIERIRDETGLGIMGIHHEPKETSAKKDQVSDLDAARGSSRFQSDPHTMMRLKIWKGRPVIVFAKMNLGPVLDPIFLDRQKQGHFVAGEAPNPEAVRERNLTRVDSILLEAGRNGATSKLIARQMKLAPRTVKKYLDEVGVRYGDAYIHKSLLPKELTFEEPAQVAYAAKEMGDDPESPESTDEEEEPPEADEPEPLFPQD